MLHPYSLVREQRWFTIISSGFIHADLPHLLFNGLTFFFFAFDLEASMAALSGPIGHLYFAIIYLGSMVLADVATIIRHKDDPAYYSLGASGAVAGSIFSFIYFFPTVDLYLLFIPCGVPAPLFAVIYLVGSWYADKQQLGNINHSAHMWGSLAGLALTLVFYYKLFPLFLEGIMSLLPL